MLAGAALGAAPEPTASDDPAQLLRQADVDKSENRAEFTDLIKRLDVESTRLSPDEQMHLRYLKAWQTAYFGELSVAISQLNSIIEESNDPTLRFRAGATVVNALAVAARYEEAYARLGNLLEQLPQISDPDARRQGLTVAAILYNLAGQHELGLEYANKLLAMPSDQRAVCAGYQLRFEAIFQSGKLQSLDKDYQEGIDTCTSANEYVYSGLMRVDAAKFFIARNKFGDAINLLKAGENDAQRTQYRRLISASDATLAQASWKSGDIDSAKVYAQRAVTDSVDHEITEPLVDGYEVLYEVAKQKGDAAAALDWHEKYATAAKGYLNDVSAHALAYQMVKQQVQEKKAQIDALSKKNQVLQLQQTISAKNVITGRLWIALLLMVLGSIGMYAYRTKRSQMKFQKLAQRDGLTGIYNRQHFIESSEQSLDYGARSVRDACVIVIDLDHFKNINDEHGHAAGDTVIKRVVAACQMHLRSVDVFGRLGGEEFGILMPDCVPERASDMAEEMRKTISEMSGFEDGPDFPVSASFGISAARWSGYNLRQLLAHADSALYQAKRAGRNRVVLHREHATATGSNLPPGMVDRRMG
jgi:diguanylate cyclase (GGDEF)-like protein